MDARSQSATELESELIVRGQTVMQIGTGCRAARLGPCMRRRLVTGGTPSFSTKSKRNEAIGRAIDEMRARAQQAGSKVDEQAGGAQEKFRQAWDRLMASVDRIKTRFDNSIERRVDPRLALRAQQATDQVRAVFSTKFVTDLLDDVFGRSKKQYGLAKPLVAAPVFGSRSDARGLAVTKQAESEFARRLRQLRERAEQTETFQTVQSKLAQLRRKVRTSPIYKKSVEVQTKIGDKIEDARDAYDTTQNPVFWTLRDAGDSMFNESEQGAALAAIRRFDPDFSLPDLIDELEHHLIPTIVKAYLRGDADLLRDVCGGDALTFVNASLRQRQAQSAHYDERILDISNIQFCDAITLETGEPVLVIKFMCQHVHWVRSSDGAVIEGSDHDIRSTYYSWALTRDTTSQQFNWRILDMQIQGIRALI